VNPIVAVLLIVFMSAGYRRLKWGPKRYSCGRIDCHGCRRRLLRSIERSERRRRRARKILAAGRRRCAWLAARWPALFAVLAAAGSILSGLAGAAGPSVLMGVSALTVGGVVLGSRLQASPRTGRLIRNPGLAWCLLAGAPYRRQLRLVLAAQRETRQDDLQAAPTATAGHATAACPASPDGYHDPRGARQALPAPPSPGVLCAHCLERLQFMPEIREWVTSKAHISCLSPASPGGYHQPAPAACYYCREQIGWEATCWESDADDHVVFCGHSPDRWHHPERIRPAAGPIAVAAGSGPEPRALFGERLEWYRLNAGMTQHGLEDQAGLSPGAVARYESGRRRPGVPTVARIAAALSIAPNQLLSAPDTRSRSAQAAAAGLEAARRNAGGLADAVDTVAAEVAAAQATVAAEVAAMQAAVTAEVAAIQAAAEALKEWGTGNARYHDDQ
jgi:transcriptional regulator with XRE-family HTH domain